MADSILHFSVAELMAASDVPEFGDFYNVKLGKRIVALALAGSEDLGGSSFGAETSVVRRTSITEQTLTSFRNSVDKLGIDASLKLELMAGKITFKADVHYLKNTDRTTNTVRVVKTARLITHRRTMNREDLLGLPAPNIDRITRALHNGAAVCGASHVCTDVTYGHYVTMTLTFDNVASSTVENIDASGKGTADFDAVQGALSGSVSINKSNTESNITVDVQFRSSEPSVGLLMPSDLNVQALYKEALRAFNDTVAQFESTTQLGASILEFTYTPLPFVDPTSKVDATQNVLADLQQQVVTLYGDVDASLNQLKRLRADPRGRFCPRFQNELDYLTDCMRTVQQYDVAVLVAQLSDLAAGDPVPAEALTVPTPPASSDARALRAAQLVLAVRFFASKIAATRRIHDAIAIGLKLSPLLSKRLELIHSRAEECQARGLCVVSSLVELGRIFNTCSEALAAVAAVPLFDGQDTYQMHVPQKNGSWKHIEVIVPGQLRDSMNETINEAVDVCRLGVNVKGYVIDALSFMATGVFTAGPGVPAVLGALDQFWREAFRAPAASSGSSVWVDITRLETAAVNFAVSTPFRTMYLVAGVPLGVAPVVPFWDRSQRYVSDLILLPEVDAASAMGMQVPDVVVPQDGRPSGLVEIDGALFVIIPVYTELAQNAATNFSLIVDTSYFFSATRSGASTDRIVDVRIIPKTQTTVVPPHWIRGPELTSKTLTWTLIFRLANALPAVSLIPGKKPYVCLDEGTYLLEAISVPSASVSPRFLTPNISAAEDVRPNSLPNDIHFFDLASNVRLVRVGTDYIPVDETALSAAFPSVPRVPAELVTRASGNAAASCLYDIVAVPTAGKMPPPTLVMPSPSAVLTLVVMPSRGVKVSLANWPGAAAEIVAWPLRDLSSSLGGYVAVIDAKTGSRMWPPATQAFTPEEVPAMLSLVFQESVPSTLTGVVLEFSRFLVDSAAKPYLVAVALALRPDETATDRVAAHSKLRLAPDTAKSLKYLAFLLLGPRHEPVLEIRPGADSTITATGNVVPMAAVPPTPPAFNATVSVVVNAEDGTIALGPRLFTLQRIVCATSGANSVALQQRIDALQTRYDADLKAVLEANPKYQAALREAANPSGGPYLKGMQTEPHWLMSRLRRETEQGLPFTDKRAEINRLIAELGTRSAAVSSSPGAAANLLIVVVDLDSGLVLRQQATTTANVTVWLSLAVLTATKRALVCLCSCAPLPGTHQAIADLRRSSRLPFANNTSWAAAFIMGPGDASKPLSALRGAGEVSGVFGEPCCVVCDVDVGGASGSSRYRLRSARPLDDVDIMRRWLRASVPATPFTDPSHNWLAGCAVIAANPATFLPEAMAWRVQRISPFFNVYSFVPVAGGTEADLVLTFPCDDGTGDDNFSQPTVQPRFPLDGPLGYTRGQRWLVTFDPANPTVATIGITNESDILTDDATAVTKRLCTMDAAFQVLTVSDTATPLQIRFRPVYVN